MSACSCSSLTTHILIHCSCHASLLSTSVILAGVFFSPLLFTYLLSSSALFSSSFLWCLHTSFFLTPQLSHMHACCSVWHTHRVLVLLLNYWMIWLLIMIILLHVGWEFVLHSCKMVAAFIEETFTPRLWNFVYNVAFSIICYLCSGLWGVGISCCGRLSKGHNSGWKNEKQVAPNYHF